MREIKLTIQKEEDLVLLEQGLNFVRETVLAHTTEDLRRLDMLDKRGLSTKQCLETIENRQEAYDRLMCLLAQLDEELENGKD